MRLEVVSFQ